MVPVFIMFTLFILSLIITPFVIWLGGWAFIGLINVLEYIRISVFGGER